MNAVMSYLFQLMALTLRAPKEAARQILDGALPRESVWLLFLLAITTSGALAQLAIMLTPAQAQTNGPTPGGFQFAVMVGGSILMVAGLGTLVGKMFGGTGTLPQLLLLMVWHQIVMVAFQAVQLVVGVILPLMVAPVAFLAVGVTLWLLSNFIAVAHGFQSALRVFWGVLGIAFFLGMLLLPFLPQLPA